MRRKGERELVVKAIQEGFKKETFDIFEEWVGFSLDRKYGYGKDAETPTRGTHILEGRQCKWAAWLSSNSFYKTTCTISLPSAPCCSYQHTCSSFKRRKWSCILWLLGEEV